MKDNLQRHRFLGRVQQTHLRRAEFRFLRSRPPTLTLAILKQASNAPKRRKQLPENDTIEVPVFVNAPEDEYLHAPISFEALDEVSQWANLWSRSCDQSIVKRAREVVKSLESFLGALDQKCKRVDPRATESITFGGLFGRAEAPMSSVSKAKRSTR
jgi:hypothetical protein